MANIKSAIKRARQTIQRRQHNVTQRSQMRTEIKKVIKAIESGDAKQAQSAYQAAVPVIDSAVSKGIIHQNKAARHKSRLNARIKALA
ncbi:MAG: 30S ribosomal protein S20 [Gammaproteobacteria bacterium]|nr:30S ribosomal protein S20 [Gammaproteobacteria bacterium]